MTGQAQHSDELPAAGRRPQTAPPSLRCHPALEALCNYVCFVKSIVRTYISRFVRLRTLPSIWGGSGHFGVESETLMPGSDALMPGLGTLVWVQMPWCHVRHSGARCGHLGARSGWGRVNSGQMGRPHRHCVMQKCTKRIWEFVLLRKSSPITCAALFLKIFFFFFF